jgi:endonuclease/exonuclease/phosphatase family metal-dependent hydrolase
MRVLTWNLQWRERADWRSRQPAILSTLRTLRPDVAGLQEVWASADTTLADELAGHLGMHAAFAAPSLPPPADPPERPDQAGIEVGVGVLSRWPILEARQHRFPSGHRPEVVALAVVADHPAGPLHVLTSCIDWEPRHGSRRPEQAGVLAALLTDSSRDGPLPVLLTGDLNAPPSSPEIRVLTEVAVDAWVAANGTDDPGHTLSSSNPLAPWKAWQLDHRIDYILARPGGPGDRVEVERSFLAGDPVDGVHPSDHWAVVADLAGTVDVRR